MGFFQQTWTLTVKNLLIVFARHWASTSIRAFIAPIVFMFFISYAKNFFVPPSQFGIGSPHPIRSLTTAVGAASGGRNTIAFINSGFTGGDIENVINQVAAPLRATGKDVQILSREEDLLTICRSSLRGVSPCYGAATFHSSPTEGPGGIWNYTLRADGSFGIKIFVNRDDNDAEIYVIPFQRAIDSAIASLNGSTLPEVVEYPYTNRTPAERQRQITRLYMGSLINILAVAYFVGIVGVTYQLTGQMASERELGMSQLIEAMMPNAKRWQPQAARLISNHLAFDIIYLPGWIIMALVASRLTFPTSNAGIVVGLHILAGLALSSWSIAFASLFRKAQLSGITVTIVSIVLAIIVQVIGISSTGTAIILSLLFPPMNYTLFIIYMAYWEQQTLPANLSKACPNAPWQFPGYVFFVLLIIQIIVFPLLGALIERTLYGTASRARKTHQGLSDPSKTVQLAGFSKHYSPTWFQRKIVPLFGGKAKETVVAVNELSMTILRGQISVLLGANGSGKSTTLDAIAGLNTVTSGTIDVDNTGGLGLCPQKNVMWDELTVEEHVRIFNRLKSLTGYAPTAEIRELVAACDLELKLGAKSKTLSGGQKRKLQLAMMFTGGSSVCCVDEVSSGIDPLSRRKIWDILLAERGYRTILLTTHFLDEADLLSDQITILSKGKLVAAGSAVELKHQLGGGYRVHIYHDVEFTAPREWDHLQKRVLYDQTVYQLTDSAQAAQFVACLEEEGVHHYQVNGPTIEDVFLKLAEEVRDELEGPGQPEVVAYKSGPEDSKRLSDGTAASIASEPKREMGGPQLMAGRNTTMFRQTWVLFRKRVTVLRRNYLPYAAALLIPIIAAGLVVLFVRNANPLSCSPQDQVSVSDIQSLLDFYQAEIPVGPPSVVSVANLNRLFPQLGGNVFRSVDTLDQFNSYISTRYANVTPGGFFVGQNGASSVFAYRGNYDISSAVLTQNLLDNALFRRPVFTTYQSFDTPWAPGAGKTLQLILYFGLAMCAFPGFFALYPTIERLRNVRALHYSNGVRAGPLWFAYVSFDFLIVFLASAVAIIIFVTQSHVWYYPGYLFVVFFLYGLAAILMSYVVSLFVTSQLAAFAFAAGGQCVFFLIYFISYMSIITYAAAADVNHYVNIAHFTISLVTPAGSLLRALLLTMNEFSLLCRDRSVASYPGDITVYGGPILYLIVQSLLLLGFLVWWDSGWKPAFLIRTTRCRTDLEETEGVDPEVMAEVSRVADSKDGLRVMHVNKTFGTNVAVEDITFGVRRGEIFALLGPNGAGKSTTIGLIRGDIRPTHNDGDVLIEDVSIIKHRAAARANLGVCPQFDAMDQMTVLEHLRFYARVRGVPEVEHNVAQVIHAVGLELFKSRMAAKLSGGNKRKLSLGIALMGNPSVLLLDEPSSGMDAASKRVMWRTLSAVTAGRSLVLTTHSMEEADALADRAGIMAKRMLALGSTDALRRKHGDAYYVHLVHGKAPHTSEEEMDTIKRWIRQHIPLAITEDRTFHGQLRFSVPNTAPQPHHSTKAAATTASSPSSSSAHTTPLPCTATSDTATHAGIAALFALLESHKHELGFEYYSVSQSTLDQVFLNIVGKHNVLEENYARERAVKGGVWRRVSGAVARAYHNA